MELVMISYFVNLEVMKTIDHIYRVECKHGLLCTCFLFYTLNTCIHRTSRHISACLSVCLFVYRSVHSLFLCMFERLVNAFTQNYFAIWLIVVKSILSNRFCYHLETRIHVHWFLTQIY